MPEHRGKMINWNPLIVGKIIKYAQGNEAQKEFLADVENFDPVSVEAYALITEWISVTTGTLSRSEMMIFNTSEFWSEFEENYLSWDAHIRSQMLKVIKMIAIIDIDIVLANSLTSDELNVEIFEILVEGEAARVFPVHLPKIMEYMSSRKFLQMLLESDDCKFRFRILRSFAALTDLLPLNNPIIMRLMDFMECGCEAKILEILMFFMKKILILPPPKPIQEHIFEVIKIGCESDDQTVRKNAFFVLQHFLQDFFFPVDSVTCYIAIVNAIAQNQSHLMCPAISMLPKVEGMELKWQILLLRCILRTQNRQIVCPTLKYITSREDFRDILQDILSLAFAALNQIQIHRGGEERDAAQRFCLKAFTLNWKTSIEHFATISWLPFPLYSILTYITDDIASFSSLELMSLKGKSQFASVCGVFIEKFPSKWISIEETMRKILEDISLISHHITEAIGQKLTYFSNELLCELLCAREGAEVSFLQKNSPLRELQFKIVNYVVERKKDHTVLELLVDRYATISRTKVMYYPNSHHHLAKLRIIQGIAKIAKQTKAWHKKYLEFILNEANQPSILYILELLVAETIPTEEIEELFRKLEDPKDLKMHSIQSIFCILFILCKKKQCRDFSRKTFRALHPWTMGQNFSCRLYAQIAMQKIFPLLEDVQEHEREMHRVVEFSFEHLSGNPEKNIERLVKDFRFNFLNVDCLLCDKYIFRDIPRITGVAESEIVHECSEGDESLANITHPWHEKNSPGAQTAVEMYDNIQTKIIPPDGFVGGTQGEGKQSSLVVCASLIENHPNLGGLARTCEIFGVQRLTLNSLRDIENSQFLALSMSAEKWLMLEEVKKWQIIAYCAEMKRQGYTIVGAEQTAKSVVLSEVAFPEKTLLVLGHEKEGLPADIISFLDIAVEIPQLGRLRSLNVHVTGSIFIYQYAMQHLLQGKN
uniref:Putative rna methylase spou family n=1 Tax=Lutzomyia longipalpis TaxID=7200 RepID=A0A1B0CLR0_LUTLO